MMLQQHSRSLAGLLGVLAISFSCLRQASADNGVPFNGSAPTSQPANTGIPKSPQAVLAEFYRTTRDLNALIPPAVLASGDKRAEFAPRAIPILYNRMELVDQLSVNRSLPPLTVVKLRATSQSLLYLLEDASTVRRVDSMIASSDPSRKLTGQIIALDASWLGSATEVGKQIKIADEIDKIDRANPAEMRLTQLTLSAADTAKSPEIEDHLLHLVLDVMTDPYARIQKPVIKQQLDDQATQQQFVGKPITLAGTSVDGSDFSTANWKGKVVLVDFWATWCAPCKAELPKVLEMYDLYHARGLEIVGISSDSTAKPLQDFLAQGNLPWPQLFDAQTAKLRLHPLCTQFNITGLPAMYIIDKQGILRSVTGWRQMEDMIPALLAQSDPTTQKTAK